jgi:hypothetical protein
VPTPQSSQRSDEFHKLIVSGAAPETATTPEWINGVMDYWIAESSGMNRWLFSPLIHYSINPQIQFRTGCKH